jgi:hypothetical protein
VGASSPILLEELLTIRTGLPLYIPAPFSLPCKEEGE